MKADRGPPATRRLRRLPVLPLLALLWLAWVLATAPARAAADCPPQASPPTAGQLRDGLRDARDRGLLWRIDKDGQTGWLYGTLHVGRPAWASPGPRVHQALREADTVALELDLADPAVLQAFGEALAGLKARDAAQPCRPGCARGFPHWRGPTVWTPRASMRCRRCCRCWGWPRWPAGATAWTRPSPRNTR